MDNVSFTEKRAHPRFCVSINGCCTDNNCSGDVAAFTQDISAGGLGLVTDTELKLGSIVEVTIEMPDTGEKIKRKARVVWTSFSYSAKYRAGIKLEDAQIKAVNLVLRIINFQRKF